MKGKITKNRLKEGDIFHARYKERERNDLKNWAFEGLLVVMVDDNHEKWLVDTYWGVNKWDNKKWLFSDAVKDFHLDFYVNLNDIEPIQEYSLDEYEDADIYTLHDQHSCVPSCVYYFKSKKAVKSCRKKIASLQGRIEKDRSEINYLVDRIGRTYEEIQKINLQGLV